MKLLELTLLIRESQMSYDRLGVLDSRIKNGRLSIYNGWGGANGRFKIISRPKFVGIYKKKVEHSFKIKINRRYRRHPITLSESSISYQNNIHFHFFTSFGHPNYILVQALIITH